MWLSSSRVAPINVVKSSICLDVNSTASIRKPFQHQDIVQLLREHNPKRKLIDLLVINAKGAEPIIFPHIGSRISVRIV